MIPALAVVVLLAGIGHTTAANEHDLASIGELSPDYSFLDHPPGTRISIGASRLHLDCRGSGVVTMLFEAGLGGSALEWLPVRKRVESLGRTCTYDRAGYAWSDPVFLPRDAARLALELDILIDRAGLDGPIVLVAHSFGGFIARLLRERRPHDIVGLVLVDSSHEDQFTRLASAGATRLLPRGKQFVLWPSTAPDNLPIDVRRQIDALSHLRKTYSATHGEMAAFAESARQVRARRAAHPAPFDAPLAVVRRGRRLYGNSDTGRRKDAVWAQLQIDLATLSTHARVLVAPSSGHNVQSDQPEVVAEAIRWVISEAIDE